MYTYNNIMLTIFQTTICLQPKFLDEKASSGSLIVIQYFIMGM